MVITCDTLFKNSYTTARSGTFENSKQLLGKAIWFCGAHKYFTAGCTPGFTREIRRGNLWHMYSLARESIILLLSVCRTRVP
jgi:hypothetical protein